MIEAIKFKECCPEERWAYALGYAPYYAVSSCGRFASCKKRGSDTDILTDSWKVIKVNETAIRGGRSCYQVTLYKAGSRRNKTSHRILYESFYGTIPKRLFIDHINRNPLDNHLRNLRVATPSENQINSKDYQTSGIHLDCSRKTPKYRTKIYVNGQCVYLGQYKTFEEAYQVRKLAEQKYYPAFSVK